MSTALVRTDASVVIVSMSPICLSAAEFTAEVVLNKNAIAVVARTKGDVVAILMVVSLLPKTTSNGKITERLFLS